MAKFELKFLDSYDNCTIQTIKVADEKICIEIFDPLENMNISIFLDKSTAIKFSKTLRTEINKITV